jgi:serine-type D-Ala-D-Ala carboxypeptidase/endopeptidase (penicillin-binding protein 4)
MPRLGEQPVPGGRLNGRRGAVRRLFAPAGALLLSGCAAAGAGSVGARAAEPAPSVMMPAATVPLPTTRALLQHVVDSVTAAPMWRNARLGILVVDPVSGDTLVSHDADRLFMPASNQKLLTGAIALHHLGTAYQWRTPVLLHGVQRGSTFTGDVLVVGSGDPSISDALRGGRAANAFDVVVQALRARGIRRVHGHIAAAGDAMPGLTSGYGWAWDDFDYAYSAAVDELLFNEGELTLQIRAAEHAGMPVQVQRAPTARYPRLMVEARTRARDTAPVLNGAVRWPRLEAAYDSIGDVLVVRGTLPEGDSATLTVAYRHPADAFTAALEEALLGAGIAVQAPRGTAAAARARNGRMAPASTPTDTLAVILSAPFADVLTRMQKPSQNQVAELLFRSVGLHVTGSGSADSAQAVAARTLAQWGVTSADAAYRDGSGLSRHNYVTPRAIVRVLDAMRTAPHFDLYRQALPIAGVDGTIRNRMRGTPAEGNARAKTGTLDKTRSLSGYVTTADQRLLLFSILANNFTVPNREVERVQDLIVSHLAAAVVAPASRQ